MTESTMADMPDKLVQALDKLVREGLYGQHDSEKYSSKRKEFWRIYLKDLSNQAKIDENTRPDGMVNAGWVQYDGRGAMQTLYMIQSKVLDDRFATDRAARAEIAKRQKQTSPGAGSRAV